MDIPVLQSVKTLRNTSVRLVVSIHAGAWRPMLPGCRSCPSTRHDRALAGRWEEYAMGDLEGDKLDKLGGCWFLHRPLPKLGVIPGLTRDPSRDGATTARWVGLGDLAAWGGISGWTPACAGVTPWVGRAWGENRCPVRHPRVKLVGGVTATVGWHREFSVPTPQSISNWTLMRSSKDQPPRDRTPPAASRTMGAVRMASAGAVTLKPKKSSRRWRGK